MESLSRAIDSLVAIAAPLGPLLESNERGQGLSLLVDEASVPATLLRGEDLVDGHRADLGATGDLHGLGVPLGTESLRESELARMVVAELGQVGRDGPVPRGHEGLVPGELLHQLPVLGSPGNAADHLALACGMAEVEPLGTRGSAVLVRMKSKAVSGER